MSCRWGAVMARSRAAGTPVMLGRKMSAAGWQGHPVFVEGGARGAPSQVGGSAGPPIGKGHRAQLCVAEFSPAWRHVPACSERVSRMRYTGATTCQKLPLGSASGAVTEFSHKECTVHTCGAPTSGCQKSASPWFCFRSKQRAKSRGGSSPRLLVYQVGQSLLSHAESGSGGQRVLNLVLRKQIACVTGSTRTAAAV